MQPQSTGTEGAVWKPEGQTAGHGSVCGKPNLVQRVLWCPWENPGRLWCLLSPGELRVPGGLALWDLSVVGCVLWQLPQHGQHLLGTLLMSSMWALLLRQAKDHCGEMAVSPDLYEFPCAFMAAQMDHEMGR